MKKRISVVLLIIILIMIVLFIGNIANFTINVEWFKEVGYLSVFFTKILAVLKLMLPIFAVCFFAIYIYYKSIRKSIIKYKQTSEIDYSKKKIESTVFIILDIIVSFVISYSFSSVYWYRILQFTNSVSFNLKDPLFNNDVSFYVFKLPLIESLYGIAMSILIFLAVITFIIYFILNAADRIHTGVRKDIKSVKNDITKFAGKQLAVVSALILLCLSLGYIIKSWNLVYSPRGVAFGASYTDVHVTLKFYYVIIAVSLISSAVIFISIIKSKIKPIIMCICTIIILAIAENITSFAVEKLVVKPNAKVLEQKYIKYNIDFTRKAFNINDIDEIPYSVTDNLTAKDISDNKDTINNIRINSYEPALEFANQIQSIKYYYNFNDIDVDRYNINGKYNQVFIAPREVNTETIDPATWQNIHLIYTHGYGVIMSKVNSVTSEGQPDFVIKDIPCENTANIPIDNPRIYFGEKINDYAIVNTKQDEFDYPDGGDVKKTRYKDDAGIKMPFINRLIFAIGKKDINFLLSRDFTSDSKILINRNVLERVKKIAPFLTYDSDPYIVINNNRLYWIVDAYTASDKYPFAQYQNNINYMRNSIKVVMDAYNGDTSFYIVDKNDPIAVSYSKIFPKLFKDADKIPEGILSHFRYPEGLFNIQCNVLKKYHMTDPEVFFDGGDLWEISQNIKQTNGEKKENEAPYVVMKLKNQSKEEMVLVEYFNVRDKENMAAMFGVRMDSNNYGKMFMYKFPSQKTIYSPYMFKQKLSQDPKISQEVSLWDTKGSTVQFGDTIIVPVNSSLLYVEPMYLRASGKDSIPEVKKIVVSYSDKTILADSIEDALAQIFNYKSDKDFQAANGNKNINNSVSNIISKDKLNDAKKLYDKAIEYEKNGDWASYGEYIKKLGNLLGELTK